MNYVVKYPNNFETCITQQTFCAHRNFMNILKVFTILRPNISKVNCVKIIKNNFLIPRFQN